MTDYIRAAQSRETICLSDGSLVTLHFNPAGTEGWLIDVIYAYDHYDNMLVWNTDGISLGHDLDII